MSIITIVIDGFITSRFKSFVIVMKCFGNIGAAVTTIIKSIAIFGRVIKRGAAWAHFLDIVRTAPLEFTSAEREFHFSGGVKSFLCLEEEIAPRFIVVRFTVAGKVHGGCASFLEDIG